MKIKDIFEEVMFDDYNNVVGGWGLVKVFGVILQQEYVIVIGMCIFMKQNKLDGFVCVSCFWVKLVDLYLFEFCENGVKVIVWEIIGKCVIFEFFVQYIVIEMECWNDFELEFIGCIIEFMKYDVVSDCYLLVLWNEVFDDIVV